MWRVWALAALITAVGLAAASATAGAFSGVPTHGPQSSDAATAGFKPGEAVLAVHIMSNPGKRGRSQVTVELAPNVKTYLENLATEGVIQSPQDFIRHAIEKELAELAKKPWAGKRRT